MFRPGVIPPEWATLMHRSTHLLFDREIEAHVTMAHVTMAVAAMTLLLALAGSVSAQDSSLCLSDEPFLLIDFCPSYLTDASVTAPDSLCCAEVNSITASYGAGCLCQIVLQGQADPSAGVIPGRAASLATLCNSDADMSKCAAPALGPAAGASPSPPSSLVAPPPPSSFDSTPPRIFLRTPPPPGEPAPVFGVPLGSSASAFKGSTASKAAIVGGSVAGGGVSILGLLYLLVRYIPQCININIDYDLNKPCCCCRRRHDKPENTAGGPVPAAPHQAYPHVPPPVQHWRPYPGTHHWV